MTLRARLLVALVTAVAFGSVLTGVGSPSQAAGPGTAAREDVVTTGNVVWTSNRRPIRGVTVYVYDVDGKTRFGSDVTDRYGRFTIDVPDDTEEYGIYVQGRRVGYAAGWVGCDKTLKPSFGAACTHSANVGLVLVKKL